MELATEVLVLRVTLTIVTEESPGLFEPGTSRGDEELLQMITTSRL
jgi:hypothetical protein